MRTVRQPAYRATVIVVAHNTVKNHEGSHGFSHNLGLRGGVQGL